MPTSSLSPIVVVCGTFHRDPDRLKSAISELTHHGAHILSPTSVTWTSDSAEFVFSKDQVGSSPREVELHHLTALAQADFVWLHAPNGYVGLSGAFEIGYASSLGVPIFSDAAPSNVTLREFVTVVDSPHAALHVTESLPAPRYLARLHQTAYDVAADEYDARVDALLDVTQGAVAEFTKWLPARASVLDAGCGVGLAVKVLSDAGFRAEGIDFSPAMVTYARARNPGRNIISGDIMSTDFGHRYDGILAFAFIHLFPKKEVPGVLDRLRALLVPGGALYIGTTEAEESSEGLENKGDYAGQPPRWRSHYAPGELEAVLVEAGYTIRSTAVHVDAFSKRWFDVVATRN